ncbi:uncharacterized protein [Gorilla gorilla gorilla]|uniref:uncharacterized protein isoform X2 n=1 Tax=Gorilla gorilla gorilla TaxID=9595 RepID=UPI0024456EF1|nr:uncharacterized protein LOC129525556 isoform X2 [Gorilla gorilla gorilla]
MAYLGPYPTSRQSPQMSLLPHNSLHRHSSIVTMASLDPAPASQPSLQALNFLRSPSVVQGWRVVVLSQLTAASTFQAEAILPSQRPTWLRLQVGPSSFRKTSLTRPLILHYDSSGPASASLWTPQAKLPTFQQLLHTQLPPASGLFRPMGLIPHNSLSRPSFSLPVASPGREPPQVGLSRPTCTLRASSPGQGPLPGCVSRPDSCLSTTSLDSVPTHLLASLVGPQLPQAKLPRPRSGLTVASPG